MNSVKYISTLITSAPRIVVVSVIFFPMGLFYYSSANGSDYTINARNPPAASPMKRSPHETGKSYAKSHPNGRLWLTTALSPRALSYSVQLRHASTGQR